jgi:hypothetical protein
MRKKKMALQEKAVHPLAAETQEEVQVVTMYCSRKDDV